MDGVAALPADLIQSHTPCIGCGYDLFAAKRSGNCPECGCHIAPSADMAAVLHDTSNRRTARGMARSLLISSIFAGLCPASCLLALNMEHVVGAVAMTVAFATCAGFAAKGEAQRRQILGVRYSPLHRNGSPLIPDAIAAVGLLLVNLAGYLYTLQEMSRPGLISRPVYEMLGATSVGLGFFLLCVTAWRAVPTWRAHADLARLLQGKRLGKLLRFLAWTKAIYETLWLACCWTPFAFLSMGDPLEEIGIGLAMAAFFGLFGFGVLWLLMIIAHSILLVQIRNVTRLGLMEASPASPRTEVPVGG